MTKAIVTLLLLRHAVAQEPETNSLYHSTHTHQIQTSTGHLCEA